MLSVIKNKVIVTGLDRSKEEAGRPVRRKVRDAVCTREGVMALKRSGKIPEPIRRTW